MDAFDSYQSPLETRYASQAMRRLWSARHKFTTWRRIWVALADAQRELSLPITQKQVDELRANIENIDFNAAAKHEARLRHDVMAHVHAFGDAVPGSRGILHLGATSQDIVCNADVLVIRDSLRLIATKLARLIDALSGFAVEYRDRPTLAFTHYQPAQPTTVGKRAALWAYEFVLGLEDVEHRLNALRFRGFKGATGTQASFLALFGGDERKVDRMEALAMKKLGVDSPLFAVTSQTYPRVVDAMVLASLAAVAAVACKFTNDVRLLANRKEIEEPFEPSQIGSSAMPYKRNPMRCERAAGMARFVMSLAQNPLHTEATQWLERTLDDSANRRMALPEAFLALDGVLDVLHNVASGLVVYEKTIRANLDAELPFMASENLLMAAVSAGADRQEAHEVIRTHSQAAAAEVKEHGRPNDLMERLRGEPMFKNLDLDGVLNPGAFVGRAPEQVDRFMAEVIEPVRARYADALARMQCEDLRV